MIRPNALVAGVTAALIFLERVFFRSGAPVPTETDTINASEQQIGERLLWIRDLRNISRQT